MAKYRVGTSDQTWRFKDAYHHAKSGDILELEDSLVLQLDKFAFNKDITIVGRVEYQSDGSRLFYSNIEGSFVVHNQAVVTFENIWIEAPNNSCCASIVDGSTVTFRNAMLSSQQESNNYHIITVRGESKLVFEQTNTQTINEENNECICVMEGSTFEATNAYLSTRIAVKSQANLILNHVTHENYNGNTINIQNGTLVANDLTLEGGNAEKDYPAIWAENSELTLKNSSVKTKGGIVAFNLNQHALLRAENLEVSAISVNNNSILKANAIRVLDRLNLYEVSYANVENLVFEGFNPTKISLFVSESSTIVGRHLQFSQVEDPNMRLLENSYAFFEQMSVKEGEVSSLIIDCDETSFNSVGTRSNVAAATPVATTDEPEVDSYEALQKLVGLEKVKKEIDTMIGTVEYNRRRLEAGMPPIEQSLHSLFLGNPGTGKTTVARLIGKILYEKGALKGKEFKFVEVDASDLLSGYMNQTAEQTKEKLESALGGVLFIDEAYALHKKGMNDTGAEAVTTILKFMEDHRSEIMVIFAGYTKEMEGFMTINPGLKSRVPNHFNFEDYTPDQIVEMGLKDFANEQYIVDDIDYYTRKVKKEYQVSLDHSNGRWIRNFNQQVKKALAYRVIQDPQADIAQVTKMDIDAVLSIGRYEEDGPNIDAMEELQSLVGLARVKEQVEEFISQAELNRKREEAGHKTSQATLHSLFLGNPGTGKTTVARIVGELLYQKGLIPTNKFYEVSRGDLIGGYQGQTAEKTREHLNAALGGVLFIDEAYSLKHGSGDSFGQEAIDEILKFMEDHRQDMVVILAGYYKEMQEFLQTNSGLTSRVPNVFDFDDYTEEEVVKIGELGLKGQGYQFDDVLYAQAVKQAYAETNDHSNGRWIRNFNQKLIGQMSRRVARDAFADVNVILTEDLEKMLETPLTKEIPTVIDEDGFVIPK